MVLNYLTDSRHYFLMIFQCHVIAQPVAPSAVLADRMKSSVAATVGARPQVKAVETQYPRNAQYQ